MNAQEAAEMGQQALWTALILSAPVLLAGLTIGLFTGFLQTVTQVHDPALSLIPKIIGVGCVVLFCLPWLLDRLLAYSHDLLGAVPVLGGG